MGHESRIEPWSPHLTAFCFVGFGTDRLRCEQAMKTAGRENPNRWAIVAGNRAPGADGQNRSSSITWAAKQERLQPMRNCFFLTSLFIELTRTWHRRILGFPCEADHRDGRKTSSHTSLVSNSHISFTRSPSFQIANNHPKTQSGLTWT